MSRDNNKGFTLIELMLSMTFLSVLLLAIAMTVIQIGNIYNRGLILKEVNQTGRTLSTELKTSINQSTAFPINYPTVGTKYIQSTWGGRLCLGQYSYIWNYGATLNNRTANATNSNVYTGNPATKIRFIKVADPTGVYCTLPSQPTINPTGAVELLAAGTRDLVLHAFTINFDPAASDTLTGQRLYTISFVVGTNDLTELNANADTCLAPSQQASNIVYCAVNEFNITARAANAVQ